jgi:hypothetical protein
MGNPDLAKPTEQPGLSDADIERIVDAFVRRVPQLFRPDPAPATEMPPPRHVDIDDLIAPKKAAALVGRHEMTISRWQNDHDISEVVAGVKAISRRKLLAHAALHPRHQGEDDDP